MLKKLFGGLNRKSSKSNKKEKIGNKDLTKTNSNSSTASSESISFPDNVHIYDHTFFKFDLETLTKRHLIVDDSNVNRYVLYKYLERFGIKVDEANNGEECLAMVEEDIDKYDVIWMDLRMPKMDGIEATQKLRTELKFNRYIIGLTGHVDYDSVKKCMKLGMNRIIAKPLLRNELYSLLYDLFKLEERIS